MLPKKMYIGLSAFAFLINLNFLYAQTDFKPSEKYWQTRQAYKGEISEKSGRQVFLLNQNWSYLEEGIASTALLNNAKTRWQKIDLPHTWNQWDATDNDPGYRRDTSWYKKEIFVPDFKGDRLLRLHFEGVNISSEVFVNGKKVGAHIGGYVGFTMDITPYIKKGATNEILVKADNSINREIIPSQKSDFFIYGGITRDVWLEVLPQTHIDRLHVRTPSVDSLRAETEMEVVCATP